ncbi:MAG: cobalamin biosynthesis protein, partial [Candidatus Competibacter sp.]
MSVALLCIGAVWLDYWQGEPRRWHPLVGFGWLARR